MKIKNRVLRETYPLLKEKYGDKTAEEITESAAAELEKLIQKNADESRAVKAHTVKVIYPVIALYTAMQSKEIDKKAAFEFLDYSCSKRAEPKAESMRAMCKIPGVYKKMPAIFKWVTVHQFGEKAGFKAKFYDMGKNRVKFDMTKCLYCEVCQKNGCPELTVCFCHTDDVTDGNMHPNIRWNRTKTMGEGCDVCDFDLIVGSPDRQTRN